ncbi:MAG: hypothetical protein WAM42_14740 [Candidatus Nitrosopolaris sp.]|jgi:hypothetical protein
MIVNYHQSGKEVTGLIRTCYACGSDKTVQYQYTKAPGIGISELWYTNEPTGLVLCNRCYCYLIKNPRHDSLCQPGITYSYLHEWIRKNRPKPLVCEECHIGPPREVANIDDIYEKDISHFRWMCVSCHAKLDGRGRHHSSRARVPYIMKPIDNMDYRKRTIYLPESLDTEMRVRSARDDMSYSEAAVIAFEEYVKRKK